MKKQKCNCPTVTVEPNYNQMVWDSYIEVKHKPSCPNANKRKGA